MPGFHDSFWSSDYAGGLGILFGKLQQGVAENQQILTIARMRAEAEDVYGMRLGDIGGATDRIQNGFSRDDGASVKKAYDGVRNEMQEASQNHRKIASSIRELVVNPFTRWCDAHTSRVQGSQDDLQARIKHHDQQAETVRKLRSTYFNKCRLVEDIEEENKLAFQEPAPTESSPKPKIPEIKVQDREDSDDEEQFEIGDEIYQPDQVKKILAHMMTSLKLGETKVPILGTYQNTTSGAEIVEYLQRGMGITTISHSERIGQDLVTLGFLRLVGNVGNTFANSSKMFYQWRPRAFKMSGIPDKKLPVTRTFSIASNSDTADSPIAGTVSEILSGWNLVNQYPNETPAARLRREASEADQRYRAAVRKLDHLRSQLEEGMIDHLKFMERCELDRLKAIKAVILDFSGAIGNVIPSLQSAVDKMLLYQETVQPLGDLRYMLENYRTGGFAPKVVIYENYYNSADEQTFGVDLEARARGDKKRVPNVVTTILTFLDSHYPDLEGDEARRGVWLLEVPLSVTHRLRAEINNGKAVPMETLERYEIPIVASVLKLYLLELPDSLVSSHVYEIIKTIYTTPSTDADQARVSVLINTLIQLRLVNIATLDAIMTHFTRLIDLTSADEQYVSTLAHSLASCILRPRTENSMTMEEKHAYRLIRDLFTHKDAIFSELKRASSLSHSTSVGSQRPRAISTDESNRKANMEARQRAILAATPTTTTTEGGSRSRATSPAPGARGHRRDRSSGGPGTRFPIQTSPTSTTDRTQKNLGGVVRNSLEVPAADLSTASGGDIGAVTNGNGNGSADIGVAEAAPVVSATATMIGGSQTGGAVGVEKKNSLGRAAHTQSSSIGKIRRPVGVSLSDKPMDD